MRVDLGERRLRDERLEAARYGAVCEVVFDPERFLRRIARTDERMASVIKSLDLARDFGEIVGMAGRQAFAEPLLPMMVADYGAVAPGAATDTVLWTPNTTTQTHTYLPGNTLLAGQRLAMRGGGIVSTPAAAGTITITPRYGLVVGGVSLGPTIAMTGTNSQTNVPWFVQFFLFIRAQAAAATAVGLGSFESNAVSRDGVIGGTTATIDTTAASGILLSANDSVAAVSYTPKGLNVDISG